MDYKHRTKEKVLLSCTYVLFALYIVLLFRITLFKQVKLYNLFAAIGSSERAINMIPFMSILEMINSDISMMRIVENVLGNVAIFMPLGLLLPVILKRESKDILLGGLILSASIEISQFICGLGSTDIDDLIFNMLGCIIGYWLFKVIKRRSKSSFSLLTTMVALLTVSGTIGISFLLVTNTDLLVVSPKKMIIENKELVQEFIEMPMALSGKLVEVKDSLLTVEKSVQSAAEQNTLISYKITANSRVYVCHYKIEYFFNSIIGEHKRYEQISYSDFISKKSDTYSKSKKNVNIWSSDGEKIDNLVIIEWVN